MGELLVHGPVGPRIFRFLLYIYFVWGIYCICWLFYLAFTYNPV